MGQTLTPLAVEKGIRLPHHPKFKFEPREDLTGEDQRSFEEYIWGYWKSNN